MTIIITPHAEQRMKDRRMTSVQIGMILQEPKEIIRVKYGRLAAYGNIRNRKLVIIYEKRNENIKVITVLWVDKRRLKTLGFTRI
ncbi:MAG: DUF4258 domain-containing protein [Candidatus Bathyarchaeia archaeon]